MTSMRTAITQRSIQQRLSIILTLSVLNFALFACGETNFSSSKPTEKKPATKKFDDTNPDETDTPSTDDESPIEIGEDDDIKKQPTITPPPSIVLVKPDPKQTVPEFGLLVNDLTCGLCHVRVLGNIVSTSKVEPLWHNSVAQVAGQWFATQGFDGAKVTPGNAHYGVGVSVTINAGPPIGVVPPNTSGNGLGIPKDLDKDGKPDFPLIAFATLDAKMAGKVSASGVNVTNVHQGNLVLVGTNAQPIEISGEVLVKGDLVIKGRYKGIGNIYVTGNIYIPADLLATKTPFPFTGLSIDQAANDKYLNDIVTRGDDALALAAQGSIIVSVFEGDGDNYGSVFKHTHTPADSHYDAINAGSVYNWYPGGRQGYEQLFETTGSSGCVNPAAPVQRYSLNTFSRIDAFLYAVKVVGGRASRNSFAINGGVIANHFHIISGASFCSLAHHPVHGLDQQWSYVSYDYRLKTKRLLLLKQLAPYFD